MNRTSTAAYILLIGLLCFFSCKQKQLVNSAVTIPDYKKGEGWLGKNSDSAFYYFNKVATSSRDSLEIATSYNNMAAIQSDAGDYYGSQESLLTSLKYLHEGNERDVYCLSSDYNELGNTNLNLKNYDAAIEYFDKAIQFSKDPGFIRTFINNKAVCYQNKKDYTRAIALCDSILEPSKKDSGQYARILSNLGRTKWLENPHYNAAPELLTAMHIRQLQQNDWGLNATYAHVSDYYASSKPDSAFYYAQKMYAITQKIQSPDDELEALKRLIQTGPIAGAKPYFARYQLLGDSLLVARNAAKNQFALIRYDAEKNKTENLTLQKDNTEKKLQLVWQRIILAAVLLFIVLAAWWGIAQYKKRRQKLLWETDNAIRTEKLKTSQKVHDVVANGLYRIMSEIEHQPEINKQRLLDNIDSLYEQSRDISYEKSAIPIADESKSIAGLLLSFDSPATRIMILGNDAGVWQGVASETMVQVEHILQELMINMKKHSEAENVVIKFERVDDQVNMDYTDDGVGMPNNFSYGNGLRNTENRIRTIGGNITFDTSYHKGLHVLLYFTTNHP